MRRVIGLSLSVVLLVPPGAVTAGEAASSLSLTPSTVVPGDEVTVEIQLDRPPVAGSTYVMGMQRFVDDSSGFLVSDDIPFDASGHALFSVTIPDAVPGEYSPAFGCTNDTPEIDACTDPAAPDFTPMLDVVLTIGEPLPQPEYEEVVFRVTLSGPVPAGEVFGVAIECSKPCVVEDVWLVCGRPDETYILPLCAEGEFGFTAEIQAGLVLYYALARKPTDSSGSVWERHLEGSIVVREGRQTISLGYVYPGGEAPALPDTAMPQPGG